MSKSQRRRRLVGLALAGTLLSSSLVACSTEVGGEIGAAEDVQIVGVLPFTGRYSSSASALRDGALLAVEQINAAGGIESLGGAKLKIEFFDAGETPETAVQAASEALSGELPAAGIGAWLSSLTVAVTEVSERAGVPWLAVGYADSISERGFTHVYQTSAMASVQARAGLEMVQEAYAEQGLKLENIALVGDNSASNVAYLDAFRNGIAAELGLKIVADEVWASPLPDAVSVSLAIKNSGADLVVFGASNAADTAQLFSSNKQFGVTTPVIGNGSFVSPGMLDAVGAETLEGLIAITPLNPLKGTAWLTDEYLNRFPNEPFLGQDGLGGWNHIMIFKEAIELAGSADPALVNEAMRQLKITQGPITDNLWSHEIEFNELGRRVGAKTLLVQWQNGIPVTVFPLEVASHELKIG